MTSALDTPEFAPKILPKHLPVGCLTVVVYGPGEGESIVVRLPDGSVGVVDGCDGEPAFELVQALNVNALAFACMTHPHEDHFLGLDRILKQYRSSVRRVWDTGALIGRNYAAWQRWMRSRRGRRGPLNEARLDAAQARFADALTAIYSEMQNASLADPNAYQELRHGTQLLPPRSVGGHEVEIAAWGPRSSDVRRANDGLLEWLRVLRARGQTLPEFDPNVVSGALLLRWGESRVLLAGDLCNDSWTACHPLAVKVHVVNVAHHASAKAHDTTLWAAMKPDLAIVTPFQHATGSQPPQPDQIVSLAMRGKVAITAPPSWCGATHVPRPHLPFDLPAVTPKSMSKVVSCPAPGPLDRHNAVAVSMDALGNIVRVVLARHARFYR